MQQLYIAIAALICGMLFNETLANISAGTASYLPVTSSSYLNALIILAASLVLAKIADFAFEKLFMRITAHTETDIDDRIIDALKSPIFYAVLVLGLYASLHSLPLGEGEFFYIDNLLQTAFVIIAATAAIRIAGILIRGIGGHVAARTKSSLDKEMLPLFNNIAKIVVIFAALMAILSAWNIDVTPLLASAGIIGIALAFAAQSTVANLFGGIAVYFDRPFKIGDRIQLESGEIGDIIEVGVRSTRIKTLEDTLIIIPNEKIANSKVTNFNQPAPRMNIKVNVGVAYGSDVANVKKTLLKAAKSSPAVLKEPAPQAYFSEHADFALKFMLVAWIENPVMKITALDQLNEGIAREFAKAKIEIPFPTQAVLVKKG